MNEIEFSGLRDQSGDAECSCRYEHRNRTVDHLNEHYYHKERNDSEYVQLFTAGSEAPHTEVTGQQPCLLWGQELVV